MGNTKGVTANNYVAYVQDRATPEQLGLIQERMTPAARETLFGGPILTVSFVDFNAVMELLVTADEVIGRGDQSLLREASYANQVKNLNGIYRALLPLISLEFLIGRASKLWARYHDTGHMSCERAGPHEVQLTLWDYPDIPEHHAPEIEGAFEALMEVAKVKNPRIVHTHCANRGDACCRWSMTWSG